MTAITQWPDSVEFVEPNNADFAENADGIESKNEFQIKHLPGTLRACVEDCVRVYGVEADLPAIIGLSIVSAAIGKGLRMHAREYKVRGNLYSLASAPSGAGKSSCFRPFVAPLQDIEKELMQSHEAMIPRWEAERDLLEAEAGRIKRGKGDTAESTERMTEIKKRIAELETECTPSQLIAENVTIEALAVILANNDECLSMLSPDGSEVITNWLGRYNKTDRTDEGLLLKAWTGEPCRINRLSRKPVSLHRPCLSLILCCTPDEIRNLYGNERFVTGGLMPRFLCCESKSRPKERNGQSEGLDSSRWESWNKLIKQLYLSFHQEGCDLHVRITSEAQEIFDAAHNSYCRSFDKRPDGDAFEARRVEQAMRIALCLHAAEHSDDSCMYPLTEKTARAGLQFAEYFGQTAARMQVIAIQSQDMAMIERIEETARNHGIMNPDGLDIPVREITRRNGIDNDTLRALVLRNPDSLKLLKITNTSKRGRPSDVLRIKNEIV